MDDDMPEPEGRMSAMELGVGIVDDFHDWIDGDDWPALEHGSVVGHPTANSAGRITRYDIKATFASGARFHITVEEIDG